MHQKNTSFIKMKCSKYLRISQNSLARDLIRACTYVQYVLQLASLGVEGKHLLDTDYADDMALLDSTKEGLQKPPTFYANTVPTRD